MPLQQCHIWSCWQSEGGNPQDDTTSRDVPQHGSTTNLAVVYSLSSYVAMASYELLGMDSPYPARCAKGDPQTKKELFTSITTIPLYKLGTAASELSVSPQTSPKVSCLMTMKALQLMVYGDGLMELSFYSYH